jgi:hypothetical protein
VHQQLCFSSDMIDGKIACFFMFCRYLGTVVGTNNPIMAGFQMCYTTKYSWEFLLETVLEISGIRL